MFLFTHSIGGAASKSSSNFSKGQQDSWLNLCPSSAWRVLWSKTDNCHSHCTQFERVINPRFYFLFLLVNPVIHVALSLNCNFNSTERMIWSLLRREWGEKNKKKKENWKRQVSHIGGSTVCGGLAGQV